MRAWTHVGRFEISVHDFVGVQKHHCLRDTHEDPDPLTAFRVEGLWFMVLGFRFKV